MTPKIPAQSSLIASETFEHHLDEFRKEAQSATQFFYAMLAINEVAWQNKSVLDALNNSSLFWQTNIGALQTAFFITLGRIFDQDSKYNVDVLIGVAQRNIGIFSKAALAARKRAANRNAEEWLPEYLRSAYEPSQKDFRCMRRYIKKYRKVYAKNYDPIRDKIYAHKELAKQEEKHSLFAETRIVELQKLLGFLNQLQSILWELYVNGKAPRILRLPYSVKRMLREEKPGRSASTIQEDIVIQVQRYLSSHGPSSTPNVS